MTALLRLSVLFALTLVLVTPRAARGADDEVEPRHSIEVSPISPFIRIYAVHYGYMLTPRDELVVGPAYMNIRYDFGHTNAAALILGYRRYLWKNLHLEYQLWPIYDWFWEAGEEKVYPSFDLWNEARLGYRFDFHLGEVQLYVTPQWAFGFGLYAQNKPASFEAARRENPIFTAPLLFLGVKL